MARESLQPIQDATGSTSKARIHLSPWDRPNTDQQGGATSVPTLESPFILREEPQQIDLGAASNVHPETVRLTASAEMNAKADAHVTRFVSPAQGLPNPRLVSRPLQQWEGVVVAITADHFDAVLKDLTSMKRPHERAAFSNDEVEPDDAYLIAEGAVFYWFIGYELSKFGQRKLISKLRFRRLPAWTKGEISAVGRMADEMEKILGIQRATECSSQG
ncbi:MAG: hypothetical protein ACYDBH_24065 [Acidobacteriaceae bacterium]